MKWDYGLVKWIRWFKMINCPSEELKQTKAAMNGRARRLLGNKVEAHKIGWFPSHYLQVHGKEWIIEAMRFFEYFNNGK